MTGHVLPPMTDDRLDRMTRQLLAERAEDVASLALPAEAMAERIATGLRPAYGSRAGLVLVMALLLLLTGIVAAAVVGWRPLPLSPVTFECEALPSLGIGRLPDQYSVRDETGLIIGCRVLEPGGTSGPPLASFEGVSVEITKANADSTLLLVIWTKASCELTARLDPAAALTPHMELEVIDGNGGRCTPGSGPRAIELALENPLSPSNVSAVTDRVCDAVAPSFSEEPEPTHLINVRDEVGTLAACREVGSDEALALWETFGTPADALDATSLEITPASADDTRLLVLWILRNCDTDARIVLAGDAPDRLNLVVTQDLDGVCAPGTGLRGVELTFDQALSTGIVFGVLNRVRGGP